MRRAVARHPKLRQAIGRSWPMLDPREIVGDDPRLLYSSEGDAIERIDRVLSDPDAQRALAAHVRSRRDLFSSERFVEQFRDIVATFCSSLQAD